jgi:hypothetical protein
MGLPFLVVLSQLDDAKTYVNVCTCIAKVRNTSQSFYCGNNFSLAV